MRRSGLSFFTFLIFLTGLWISGDAARAQTLKIAYPEANQQVRGEIVVRFSGVPEGGYVVIKLDGQLVQATADNFFTLNTFNYPDGTKRVSISAIGSGGKNAGNAEVSFEIANGKVATNVPGVPLSHWKTSDIYDDKVTRYRVFAEAIASITGGTKGGAGGAGGGGMGGGAGGGGGGSIQFVPSPLDWQVVALIRSKLRDVGMIDDSANIKYVVQLAQQRQRLSEGSGGGGGGAGAMGGGGGGGGGGGDTSDPAYMALLKQYRGKPPLEPILAPWKTLWELAPETGEYRVRMITQGGKEIRATKKPPTIGLADLLPSFPKTEVRPGSTWESQMTFLGELSEREAVEVVTPMTFTTFENIKTPAGVSIRAAKMEARFRLPEGKAKDIAANLAPKVESSGGGGGMGGGGGGGAGGGMGGGSELPPEMQREILLERILNARTTISRVLWFDVENRRVVRTEDALNTYFEIEPDQQGGGGMGGGGMGGGAGGGEQAEAEPTKVNYNLRAVMWLDDVIPAPTDKYNGGAGTAHARDRVEELSISRVTTSPNP